MSKYSPGPVSDGEMLARFVFSPFHINERSGKIKPSVLSHVHLKGCSIQRESIATDQELNEFVRGFLEGNDNREWRGVLVASVKDVRSIAIDDKKPTRAVCIYDTAERKNPAHAELCQTEHVLDESDEIELRKKLRDAFCIYKSPDEFRSASTIQALSASLSARCRSASPTP